MTANNRKKIIFLLRYFVCDNDFHCYRGIFTEIVLGNWVFCFALHGTVEKWLWYEEKEWNYKKIGKIEEIILWDSNPNNCTLKWSNATIYNTQCFKKTLKLRHEPIFI